MTAQRLTDIIFTGLSKIPTKLRKYLFIGLSLIFYLMVPRQRLIATYNIRRAFPEKSESEIIGIVRNVYRNIGIVAAEFFDIPHLTKENIDKLVETEGLENCERALAKGKGLLLFSAHFGNWELEAAAAALLLKPAVVIYRRLDSSLLDQLVLRVRSATGNNLLLKDRAMRPMLRALNRNGILGILIDQNVDWYEGVFVDFFGRQACTTDGLAVLALHTEAPVLPAYILRLPDGRYRLVFGTEVEVIRTGDRNADIIANTQRFTSVLEQLVRQYPEQWLWIHQRWKTQLCQIPEKE